MIDTAAVRSVHITYFPPVSANKVVKFAGATWQDLHTRLLEAHVPGVARNSYLELMYPHEGFVCPLASDLLPDMAELTVSVHIELTRGQALQFPACSETVTGEPVYGILEEPAKEAAQKVAPGAEVGRGASPGAANLAGVSTDRRTRHKEGRIKHKEERLAHKMEKISAKMEGLRMMHAAVLGEASPPRGCRHRHGRHSHHDQAGPSQPHRQPNPAHIPPTDLPPYMASRFHDLTLPLPDLTFLTHPTRGIPGARNPPRDPRLNPSGASPSPEMRNRDPRGPRLDPSGADTPGAATNRAKGF